MHGLLVKKQCVIVGLKLLSWWIIGSLLLVIFLTVLNLKSTWFRIKIVAVQKHHSSSFFSFKQFKDSFHHFQLYINVLVQCLYTN